MAEIPQEATLRFGSLRGKFRSSRPLYSEAVSLVFGAEILPRDPERPGPERFDFSIEDGPWESGEAGPPLPENQVHLGGSLARPTIVTDALAVELSLDTAPVRIRLTVRQPDIHRDELQLFFAVVLNKILFLLDHVVLHAAAVQLHGVVQVFVGEKGAGKSTTCLGLARAGGTVLGEDHVILRRVGEGFLVSGGDERSRVTEQTERYFFPEPLPVAPRDFAGTLKKEIRMGSYFSSRPYEDFPAHRLLFPRVTTRFDLRPIKAQAALLRLLKYTGHLQRFAGPADQARFLDMLASFVATVDCYEVDLTPDLDHLARLAEALADG